MLEVESREVPTTVTAKGGWKEHGWGHQQCLQSHFSAKRGKIKIKPSRIKKSYT